MNQIEARSITVNQIGYPSGDKKFAIFTEPYESFQITSESGEIFFSGTTSDSFEDKISGKTLCTGDFSTLTTCGTYQVKTNNSVSSLFEISDKPYQNLHHGLLKAFYYFRCGMELDKHYAGPWKHLACHTSKGIVYGEPDRKLDSSGGWHDAGDYGKYTVAAAKAIADLILAYEFYPDAFKRPIPIPETDNLMPDVLHECRYELEWLFKMQDEHTGGVFHKLTTLKFPGLDVMPEDDLAELYFSPISSTATGTFTAIMAVAARVYNPFDSSFSERCLHASILAADWLTNNPDFPGFKNPSEVTTGEYGDYQDSDERFWAMAELYRTTGNKKYHASLKQLVLEPFEKYSLGWKHVGGYGTLAYLLTNQTDVDASLYTELKAGLIEEANVLVTQSDMDGFLISLKENQYIWGSNMLVMNHAMILLVAYHFTGNTKYEAAALEHLHYILGRNVHDISFVTGFGDRSVMHHHHRPSVADKVADPVPGLLSGGPDRGLNDDYVKEHLRGLAPAQCFVDHEDSYSTNEVTIYWNSPAVFVVSHWTSK
ncbi:glycoside hydrolase [Aquibacillus halophilus]|uniref:Endoglucanase n=1 Tax=Aquibacillus halophilus TaxID=930132 RepID=A0A6A8DD81_9BACI|nr:glycoside hydrolase family 9 protein [Aquibacillus halophilus]MRH43200.1 glycoside hydrolase [Aquibacillus halophilus]